MSDEAEVTFKRKKNTAHRVELVEKGFEETSKTSILVHNEFNNKEFDMGELI